MSFGEFLPSEAFIFGVRYIYFVMEQPNNSQYSNILLLERIYNRGISQIEKEIHPTKVTRIDSIRTNTTRCFPFTGIVQIT